MSKNKYLYKRHNTWWVKLSVPKTLRDKLGYDLRQTTGTSNLDEAILKRDQIVQEFRDVINTEKNLLENSKPSKDISGKSDIPIGEYCPKQIFLILSIFIKLLTVSGPALLIPMFLNILD